MADGTERTVPAELRATWDQATVDHDPLAALAASRTLARELGRWQGTLAAEAVRGGATWEQVGDALGISRQAAWARFRWAIEDQGGRPMEDDRAELKRRIQDEVRSLREAMRSMDESYRKAHTEAANQMREMQREARRERQELRDRMKESIRALQEELRRKAPA
jgi:DNA anti-recombination protein RmuC